ncbi:hypothetical protein AAY473_005895 [Plecturocebus cupreus]
MDCSDFPERQTSSKRRLSPVYSAPRAAEPRCRQKSRASRKGHAGDPWGSSTGNVLVRGQQKFIALWEAEVSGSPVIRSLRPAGPTCQNSISTKNTKIIQARWRVPVIPATQEAEAGEVLESRSKINCQQSKQTTYRMGENICKVSDKVLISRIYKEFKSTKNPNNLIKKWQRREQTLLKRRHINSQQT